jgi:hypothetical protein
MAVSRAFKRGRRAGAKMRPVSRNRRVEWNAHLKQGTLTAVPAAERKWTPIRLAERSEAEPEAKAPRPQYETETILVTNIIGVQEAQQVTRNRRHTVFDSWLHDDEEFFERRHIRVVEHARDLWRAVSMHAATPIDVGVFGTQGLEIAHDDESAARALNLLRRARSLVPRWQWNIFENVVRWNEPYGFPGSSLFVVKPQRVAETKWIVRDAAETISRSLFL